MNKEDVLECERTQLERFQEFIMLPNYFKAVGLTIAVLGFVLKVALSGSTDGNAPLKFFTEHVLEYLILLAMLIVVLSKEKIEDEMIEKLRGQAFKFAFISGVIFTIFQSFITFFVELLIRAGEAEFERLDDFIILWFMLVIYLCYFHLITKTS